MSFLPAYLIDTHFLDLTTCDGPYPNARTGCDRSTHTLNRSMHRENVNCPACLESEAFKAQGMEDALAGVPVPIPDYANSVLGDWR
jgi:hypothetical protein